MAVCDRMYPLQNCHFSPINREGPPGDGRNLNRGLSVLPGDFEGRWGNAARDYKRRAILPEGDLRSRRFAPAGPKWNRPSVSASIGLRGRVERLSDKRSLFRRHDRQPQESEVRVA